MAGQIQQNKLPDFIRRLEESLYKMAASRDEYADLSTLELRLQQVVSHIVRKPGGAGARTPSAGDGGGESYMQQLMGGDSLTPSSHSRQQAQQAALLHAQQQAHAQAQQRAATPNGGMPWQLDPGQGVGLAAQQVQQAAAQPQLVPGAGGNQLAVAGAPAGHSTAESAQRGAAGMDYAALVGGGDVTSGASLQAAGSMRQAPHASQQPGPGAAPDLGGGLGGAQLGPTFMSNGAPVLLRGAGGGGGSMMGGLVPAPNGLMPLGSGAPPLLPTGQAQVPGLAGGGMVPQLKLDSGGMVPQLKLEGGGGMVPVGGGSAGSMLSLAQQQQQQHMMQQQQQQQQQMSALGMMAPGGYGGMGMLPASNGFGAGVSLLPLGGQAGMQPQQVLMHRQQPSPALLQQQQQQQQQQHHYAAQLAHAGGLPTAGTPPLPLLQQAAAAQMGGGSEARAMGGVVEGPPTALPSLNPEADQSFNLLGGAFADLDGQIPGSGGDLRKQQILKQQRWLLFLRHCARCQLGEAQCQYGRNCTVAKQLWQHLVHCKEARCDYPRCNPSRELLRHHQKCTSPNCPVCAPVKQYVSKQRQQVFYRKTANLTPELRQNLLLHLQQNPKAREMFQQRHGVDAGTIFSSLDTSGGGGAAAAAAALAAGGAPAQPPALAALPSLTPPGGAAQPQAQPLPAVAAALAAGGAVQPPASAALPLEAVQAPKRQRTSQLTENMGTSLLEYFNEAQIENHVAKLRKKDVQVRGVPKNPVPHQEMESNCRVCELNRLTFEPPSLYCFGCGQRIKRNQVYYGTPTTHEIKGMWCHPCYQDIKTETVPLDGFNIRKSDLEKRKNDDEVEEGWVACDQCEGWVHQICGLFNKGRNDQSRGFLCPFCLRDGLRSGARRIPSERPQAMLTARDLPPCKLSERLEARLEGSLRRERELRAHLEGRPVAEVPTAEGLTVRVVNNVVKRNDVRPRLYAAVQGEGYPEAFLYRQKVILLFQNIDGVDLCLYCLYMQEYDDKVPKPNRKSVYLSYLDSVKYFQPEDVKAAGRDCALRTMVYHELLLGYLQDAKERGFESMFIWACPPLAGDDYILYCHPFKQKTPRSDRLREWYHVMLNKAKEEGIVTYVSNMWDTYFEGGRDHRLDQLSITQLPYYDGDYWPGEAENLLAAITSEAAGGGKGGGAAASKPPSAARTKASLKGKSRAGPATGTATEELFRRLGDAIQGMREDFIVVHLQEPCSYCRQYMNGGMRYYHPSPPQKVLVRSERTFDGINLDKPGSEATRTVTYTRFALCPKCYQIEIAGLGKGLPPGMELAQLVPAPNQVVPPVAQEEVPPRECEFFDTRTAFLSLCQGNHYQFDSLRRAKHSSMMVLYHLHNPTAPAFACTCNVCQREIQGGDGFRCSTCPDFDMCVACYANPAVKRHEHPMVRHARDIDERRNRLTAEQLRQRSQALHRSMAVLLHASQCVDQHCPSTSCARVKQMYKHAYSCTVKLSGNCAYCKRMWMLLQMHATQCMVPNCKVPRCMQLRQMRRQQAARAEDKRRAAYRTMVRQQAGA